MCGIFGLIAIPQTGTSAGKLAKLSRTLFQQSETRGKDASGIMSITDTQILVYKSAQRAKLLLRTNAYKQVVESATANYESGSSFVLAGHTRMVTNGSEEDDGNNQPVIRDGLLILHNGIIVNDLSLWREHPHLERRFQVDTEIFAAMLTDDLDRGVEFTRAMRAAFLATKGANTIAATSTRHAQIVLGTTNGSLHYCDAPGITIFASERFMLELLLSESDSQALPPLRSIKQVLPDALLSISLKDGRPDIVPPDISATHHAYENKLSQSKTLRNLKDGTAKVGLSSPAVNNSFGEIERLMRFDDAAIDKLIRCSKCLLPETFPFIKFDDYGVCQFCKNHKPITPRGEHALRTLADQARRPLHQADCLVPISGGRDSCYGLHYVKNVLGLNPVAYTYDWGFVTDLARRNISRMCGALNVEHILVAADIKQKRENVLKNVTAWLTKPSLSMIPLFMAGDKAFFYYASAIRKQMGLGPIIFSMNALEKTGFKTGFAGVMDTESHEKTYGLTKVNQMKLIGHYMGEILRNPKFINGSLPDTAFAFASYYMLSKDYYSIFDFLEWNQELIERTIIDEYDWEVSPDTRSTWRIGDGTAPFYNYIYLTVAGFCENDTFRSNQIREGLIDRDTALALVKSENMPRVESFKWYCDTIGLDAVSALKAINGIKKAYAPNQ